MFQEKEGTHNTKKVKITHTHSSEKSIKEEGEINHTSGKGLEIEVAPEDVRLQEDTTTSLSCSSKKKDASDSTEEDKAGLEKGDASYLEVGQDDAVRSLVASPPSGDAITLFELCGRRKTTR